MSVWNKLKIKLPNNRSNNLCLLIVQQNYHYGIPKMLFNFNIDSLLWNVEFLGPPAMYCLLEVFAVARDTLSPYFMKHSSWIKVGGLVLW